VPSPRPLPPGYDVRMRISLTDVLLAAILLLLVVAAASDSVSF
jgi:hypothetical protein